MCETVERSHEHGGCGPRAKVLRRRGGRREDGKRVSFGCERFCWTAQGLIEKYVTPRGKIGLKNGFASDEGCLLRERGSFTKYLTFGEGRKACVGRGGWTLWPENQSIAHGRNFVIHDQSWFESVVEGLLINIILVSFQSRACLWSATKIADSSNKPETFSNRYNLCSWQLPRHCQCRQISS